MCAHSGDPGPYGAREIRLHGNALALGGAGFPGPADDENAVTVGDGLVPAARGHGHATEALPALPARACSTGTRLVRGDTGLHNTASRHVTTARAMLQVADDGRPAHDGTTRHHCPTPSTGPQAPAGS
ncbi:GNAT family N-acetyltransferase [Kitasatospora sp. NPDC057542]|uniref:GNAT family N-acetyltransferase n=1 Tax=Kitasatospora sp. NPDC057542 TaxID=3346162 RepID=UPI0036966F5D